MEDGLRSVFESLFGDLELRHVALALLLSAFLIVGAGFVAGTVRPPPETPEIDVIEPNGEVVFDSLRQLESRDHTVVIYRTNRAVDSSPVPPGDGERFRLRIEHSRQRVRGGGTLGAPSGDETPTRVFFTPYVGWIDRPDGDWRYEPSSPDELYEPGYTALKYDLDSVQELRSAEWTTVESTESRRRFRTDAVSATSLFSLGAAPRNGSAFVTIATTPEPHIRRACVRRQLRGDTVLWSVYEFRNFDNTTAPRPDPMPPITAREIVNRVLLGWDRLLLDDRF